MDEPRTVEAMRDALHALLTRFWKGEINERALQLTAEFFIDEYEMSPRFWDVHVGRFGWAYLAYSALDWQVKRNER
jgi:hypothetical protein